MTNGEKIQEIFPNANIKYHEATELVDEHITVLIDDCNMCQDYPLYWWNAEYKEPTTENDLALIHTEGLDEEIRCTMCINSMKSDRGCDGSCVVNKDMYKAVMDAIEKRIVDKLPIATTLTEADIKDGFDAISRQAVDSSAWEHLRKAIKENLGVDCISRKAVLNVIEREQFKGDAISEIEKLPPVTPQEPKWIPVSERLPDIHNYSEYYLVTLKNGEVHRAMCTEMNGEHWWNYNLDDVIAWMPLPQPYREVEE